MLVLARALSARRSRLCRVVACLVSDYCATVLMTSTLDNNAEQAVTEAFADGRLFHVESLTVNSLDDGDSVHEGVYCPVTREGELITKGSRGTVEQTADEARGVARCNDRELDQF